MKMKKLFIFIALAMLFIIVISAGAVGLKNPLDEDPDETTGTTPDIGQAVAQSTFFYVNSEGETVGTKDISSLPNETRGYYHRDGKTYFAVKVSGTDSSPTYYYPEDLSYSGTNAAAEYTFTLQLTYDMKSEAVHTAQPNMCFVEGDGLLVYVVLEDCKNADAVAADLLENVSLTVSFADPGMIEGPGSEEDIGSESQAPSTTYPYPVDPGMPEGPGAE